MRQMNSYCEFSAVYDELTQNVDYPKRFEYINHFLIENNITNGTVFKKKHKPAKCVDLITL